MTCPTGEASRVVPHTWSLYAIVDVCGVPPVTSDLAAWGAPVWSGTELGTTLTVPPGSCTYATLGVEVNGTTVPVVSAHLTLSDLDGDADGVLDALDACPGADDAADADVDGVPDGCEPLLVVGALAAGQPATLAVSNVLPGESVGFSVALGTGGVGPCPAPLGGVCLSLGTPVRLLGTAVADATGTATFAWTVPGGLAGQTVALQAGVARGAGGADSVVTDVVSAAIP
jgi:hypothetical protein